MKSYNLLTVLGIIGFFLYMISQYSPNNSETVNYEKQQQNKPLNVIYIMADDHAYQAISAYGSQLSKLAPTPNIDRIANEGARMDAVYSTNSI